jgi:hypothetical protein
MNQLQIIGAIMMHTGKRVDQVAREHALSKAVIYKTIKGETRGKKPREIISGIIGKPIDEIWAESAGRRAERK